MLPIYDNASNIKKDIQDILKWNHAHALNLIVMDGLTVVDECLKKIRKLVVYFKRSTIAIAKLAEV